MSASTRNKHSKIHGNEKLDISNDEFDRIRDALKNEEFRKLFFDYVDEIQDPENRKIYEEEITQLEKERGVDVTFIHPQPGFVIKTSIDGELKCFINIASCKVVERPNNEVSVNSQTGQKGLSWSIPLAQIPPRDDLDANNKLCKVYDVVFHPDALHLAKRNAQFRQCLIDTALDGVEREYHVNLDRANLKFPKLDYKGMARPSVLRTLSKNPTAEEKEPHPLEHMYPKKPEADAGQSKVLPMKTKVTAVPKFAVPKYCIKHSHDVDMAEYTDELDAKLQVTVPRALVVEIELPLLSSTADCHLDVTEKSVYLLSEKQGAKYKLKVDLPYTVNDKAGNARFDTDHRCLRITLPVVRSTPREERNLHDTVRNLSREDSGVELNSNGESPVEDEELVVELSEHNQENDSNAFPPTAVVSPRSFLKSNLHYLLPAQFNCNILDNVIVFVLHVTNVQPDSVQTLQQARSLHLQFASMGTGYYPTHYAFLMQLPDGVQPELRIDQVEVDTGDENVVLRLTMNEHCMLLPSYLAGTDSNDLKEYPVFGHQNNNNEKETEVEVAEMEKCDLVSEKSLQINMDHNDVEHALEVTIEPQENEAPLDSLELLHEHQQELQQLHHQKKLNKKQRKRNKKQRSLSESACEDLKLAQEHHEQPMDTLKLPHRKQRSYSECNESSLGSSCVQRGILKRFSRYGPHPSISDSCSSIDDCSSTYSCSVDAAGTGFSQSFGSIPEERGGDEAGLSESCKKTVRFNDHIMKQVFRLDSSILGQRKKNQKRRDCKLRAQQRRLSEGDSADYVEVDSTHGSGDQPAHKTAANAQYFKQHNNNHPHVKDNKKQSLHDSGLDLTNGSINNKNNHSNENATKRNEADAKNTMMFEMDDVDEEAQDAANI
uniref:Protein kintoun n=1 Tax=Drosophila mojavensis TaxID=7230 RepID=KTU_DROMO|nr:RecName: Full=Protein kintoun; AltName: Full=Dynein assembly factor 2, axonemal homolog; AltName: Full=PP1-interacting protein 20 [Drosophila mojavensis]